MGLPMGQKLVKSGSTWVRLCGTHISETPGWICTIRSFMELSRPVVVQRHGHLTLTLENAVSQEWEGQLTWNQRDVSRLNVGPMLWLKILTSPMTLTLNFQCQILKWLYPRNGRADWHGMKRIWIDRVVYLLCDLELWPWPWIFKVKVWKCCISGMGGPIDTEPKGCESIGC